MDLIIILGILIMIVMFLSLRPDLDLELFRSEGQACDDQEKKCGKNLGCYKGVCIIPQISGMNDEFDE